MHHRYTTTLYAISYGVSRFMIGPNSTVQPDGDEHTNISTEQNLKGGEGRGGEGQCQYKRWPWRCDLDSENSLSFRTFDFPMTVLLCCYWAHACCAM